MKEGGREKANLGSRRRIGCLPNVAQFDFFSIVFLETNRRPYGWSHRLREQIQSIHRRAENS